MSGRISRRFPATLGAALALIALAGCASPGPQSQAAKWIAEDELQKAGLQEQGFPQYNGQS